MYPRMLHAERYHLEEGQDVKWSFYKGVGESFYSGSRKVHPINVISNFLTESVIGQHYISKRIVILEVIKIILTGIIFFFFLRMGGYAAFGSIIGALSMAFSGYMIIGGTWYVYSTVILNACLLLLFTELLISKKWWWLFPLGVYFYGGGYTLHLMLAVCFAYGVVRLSFLEGFELKRSLKFFGVFSVLAFVGLLLNGYAGFISLDKIFSSHRMDYDTLVQAKSSSWSFGFASKIEYLSILLKTLSNDLMGNGSEFRGWNNYLEAPAFYCGLVNVFLLPQIFVMDNSKRRRIYLLLIATFFLFLTFPFLRRAVYLGGNYYKYLFSFLFPLLLILIAQRVFTLIEEGVRINIPLLVVSFLLLLAAILFPWEIRIDEQAKYLCLGFTVTTFLGLLVLRFSSFGKILLILIVAAELGIVSHSTIENRVTLDFSNLLEREGYNDHTVGALRYLEKHDESFYRVKKDYYSSPASHKSLNDAMAQGFFGTSVYSALNNPRYTDFLIKTDVITKVDQESVKWVKGPEDRQNLLDLLSVKYFLFRYPQRSLKTYSGLEKVKQFGDVTVFHNTNRLPFGVVMEYYIEPELFKVLDPKTKDQTLKQAMVLDGGNSNGLKKWDHSLMDTALAPSDTMMLTGFAQNKISGYVDVKKPSMIFLSIPHDVNWKTKVNGQEIETAVADFGFTGIPIQAGENELLLEYKPETHQAGVWISRIAFLLLLLATSWYYWKAPQRLKLEF